MDYTITAAAHRDATGNRQVKGVMNNTSKSRGWKDKNHYERHYCEVCNVWMAADRASILTHTNGKKHAEKFQESQAKKSLELASQEKQKLALQKTLQAMESAASLSIQQDYGMFGASTAHFNVSVPSTTPMLSHGVAPSTVTSLHSTPAMTIGPAPPLPGTTKQEKREWENRKKQRDIEKKHKREQDHGESDEDGASNKRQKVPKISDKDGHYRSSDGLHTWLEGITFGRILEDDLPIQVWIGNSSATSAELLLSENQRRWKDGLVVAVRQRPSEEAFADRMVVDVAYLLDEGEGDTEEQLLKSVKLQHVRIQLGGDGKDGRIPSTLEEARLLAMGGEEIVVNKQKTNSDADEGIDEATGLSGWSTIKIKRTTVHNELKEERELARRKRKAAAAQAEKEAKQAEARRMEEAKVSNANDSALGAYDVWNRTNEGYKGVDIHDSSGVAASTAGKKLATDGNVAFKKNVATKKKRNVRTTSADDD